MKVAGHGRGQGGESGATEGPSRTLSQHDLQKTRFFRAYAVNTAGHRVWPSGPSELTGFECQGIR